VPIRSRTSARRRSGSRFIVRLLAITLIGTVAFILPLRWFAPLTSTFMIITWVKKPEDAGHVRYDWADRSAISRHVAASVLASEDQKFFGHAGFDFKAIADVMQKRQANRRLRGASTISQQVVKNLFLWPGRSWLRKGIEAWLTVWLELLLPKERILELHLNIAQFGPTVFGVEAASRLYFGKRAARLNRHESALLAAVLPNPVRMSVSRPSPYVRRRQQWIIGQSQRLERAGLFPGVRDWSRP
jgi:monofunctional biosynthetic peptidoglycan transglycosylase